MQHKNEIFDYNLSQHLLTRTIQDLKIDKAVGFSGVASELIKYGISDKLLEIITIIIETMINHDVRPKNINIGKIKPVVKDQKKDWNDINNLRPITISDCIAIILEKIILFEIEKDRPNNEKQFGFKKDSSCQHAIWTLREIIAYNKRRHKRTLICTIDASKAFDKINRNNLWAKMIGQIRPYLLRCLINYYSESRAVVCLDGNYSGMFSTLIGVKQGGPLSPKLFCLYMDELIETLDNSSFGIKIGNIKINNMLYADDIVLISERPNELNALLKMTTDYGHEYEVKFNPDKTNFMIAGDSVNFSQDIKIVFDDKEIERVKELKYLGVMFDDTIKSSRHIEFKIKSALTRYQEMIGCGIEDPNLASEIKLEYYRTFIRPVLYYGLETLQLNVTQIKTIQTLESKLLKSAFRISKYSKSTRLMRACRIEMTKERIAILKIKFLKRLKMNTLTNRIIGELLMNDEKCKRDEKSFLGEIIKTLNLNDKIEEITEIDDIIVEGEFYKEELDCRIEEECQTEEVRDVIEAI